MNFLDRKIRTPVTTAKFAPQPRPSAGLRTIRAPTTVMRGPTTTVAKSAISTTTTSSKSQLSFVTSKLPPPVTNLATKIKPPIKTGLIKPTAVSEIISSPSSTTPGLTRNNIPKQSFSQRPMSSLSHSSSSANNSLTHVQSSLSPGGRLIFRPKLQTVTKTAVEAQSSTSDRLDMIPVDTISSSVDEIRRLLEELQTQLQSSFNPNKTLLEENKKLMDENEKLMQENEDLRRELTTIGSSETLTEHQLVDNESDKTLLYGNEDLNNHEAFFTPMK